MKVDFTLRGIFSHSTRTLRAVVIGVIQNFIKEQEKQNGE